MNSRLINWIWQIRGHVELPPGQSIEEAFDRLDPLFRERGTRHERSSDTLTFTKKDQAPQDRMSIFNDGVLQIRRDGPGSVLHYRMTSRALLLCFLAPLLFLGFAQLTVVMGNMQTPPTEAEKAKQKAEKEIEKNKVLPQNWIDKALGAPAPERPKDKDEEKDKKGKSDEEDEDDDKPTPTPGYVFAGLFAALYVGGRILEHRLIKSLFRRQLNGA